MRRCDLFCGGKKIEPSLATTVKLHPCHTHKFSGSTFSSRFLILLFSHFLSQHTLCRVSYQSSTLSSGRYSTLLLLPKTLAFFLDIFWRSHRLGTSSLSRISFQSTKYTFFTQLYTITLVTTISHSLSHTHQEIAPFR